VEKEAASVIEAGIRHRVRPDQIGKPLQRPLGDTQGQVSQRYRGLDGMPKDVSVDVWRSSNTDLMAQLQERRSAHRVCAASPTADWTAASWPTRSKARRMSTPR
jgi:hypothetical protein